MSENTTWTSSHGQISLAFNDIDTKVPRREKKHTHTHPLLLVFAFYLLFPTGNILIYLCVVRAFVRVYMSACVMLPFILDASWWTNPCQFQKSNYLWLIAEIWWCGNTWRQLISSFHHHQTISFLPQICAKTFSCVEWTEKNAPLFSFGGNDSCRFFFTFHSFVHQSITKTNETPMHVW